MDLLYQHAVGLVLMFDVKIAHGTYSKHNKTTIAKIGHDIIKQCLIWHKQADEIDHDTNDNTSNFIGNGLIGLCE